MRRDARYTARRTDVVIAFISLVGLGLAGCAAAEDSAKQVEYDSGLVVEILTPGTGAEIGLGQTAVVHYTGWYDEGGGKKGKKFDSSVDRKQFFTVRNVGKASVIKGWNQGIGPFEGKPGMKVGEKRRLLIPAKLGYGSRGAGAAIPPNQDLVFDVELIEIH